MPARPLMTSAEEPPEIPLAPAVPSRVHLAPPETRAPSTAACGPAGFGGRAVTIVLHPFRLIRNERTGASSADADGWLSGGCETVR